MNNFHITLLNSTTVEVTWGLPYSTIGINGIVRGFKIIIDKENGNQTIIDVPGVAVRAYIITGLEQSATYSFSMLIYTVADGPQSVLLKLTMPNSGKHNTHTHTHTLLESK